MRLSKKEKELIKFAATTTMGCVSISSSNEVGNTAYKLSEKGLMTARNYNLPFCGSVSYWSLTNKGWEVAYKL